MKKLLLIGAIALLGASMVTSCGGAECQAQTKKVRTTGTTTKKATATKGVVELKNDNQYRPGTKVKKLTILDFNATWCGPCKQFSPAFHSAAQKFAGKVDFVSIDTDVNPNTAKAFGITAIPTVIFIYPNGKTTKYIGTEDILPAEKFMTLVQGALK